MLKTNNVLLCNSPDDVEKSFDEVGIHVSNTIELNNVVLTYSNIVEPKKDLPTEADKEERKWLMKEIDKAVLELKYDKTTRKAIIYNLFPSKLDHNCLSSLHLYYRNGSLDMNVYVRSMNYDDNFGHDLFTFETILRKACRELMLNKGRVTVFIMSLHKFI